MKFYPITRGQYEEEVAEATREFEERAHIRRQELLNRIVQVVELLGEASARDVYRGIYWEEPPPYSDPRYWEICGRLDFLLKRGRLRVAGTRRIRLQGRAGRVYVSTYLGSRWQRQDVERMEKKVEIAASKRCQANVLKEGLERVVPRNRRDAEILVARAEGMSYREIAEWQGVSRPRVEQIIKEAAGVKARDPLPAYLRINKRRADGN